MCLYTVPHPMYEKYVGITANAMYVSRQLCKAGWATADDRIHFARPLALFIAKNEPFRKLKELQVIEVLPMIKSTFILQLNPFKCH